MSGIDYTQRIPNNVGLGGDVRLQRALEKWQPSFLSWWHDMGPDGFQAHNVYLRTAVSTEPGGWANFGHVKMPEYRWGIFLADAVPDRRIAFGEFAGAPAWQEVPGELRAMLRRMIVVQADTEPASVEQQRRLAHSAPSLYDMRNLFQVNVEEGRHLWAMVYLLHAFFGRDGRDEADELLARRSGDADKPRILDAFNEPCDEWLSFFCFTMFTDRDGKYQLAALAESGFDPLARTCRFMLTEEAHHLFVGETGIDRVVARSAELTRASRNGRASELGGIDLELIQKYIDYWFPYCLDLFGGEISSNAADMFAAGVKGRYQEERKYTNHSLLGETMALTVFEDGRLQTRDVPARNALNEVLRGEYRDDCQRAVDKWNKTTQAEGLRFRFSLPSNRFFRRQGIYADHCFDREGNPITRGEWERRAIDWLPSEAERAYVRSLMLPVTLPGKMANWIGAPRKGINGKNIDYTYVRTA